MFAKFPQYCCCLRIWNKRKGQESYKGAISNLTQLDSGNLRVENDKNASISFTDWTSKCRLSPPNQLLVAVNGLLFMAPGIFRVFPTLIRTLTIVLLLSIRTNAQKVIGSHPVRTIWTIKEKITSWQHWQMSLQNGAAKHEFNFNDCTFYRCHPYTEIYVIK